MKNQRQSHDRRSIRLQGFDYSAQGMYFITICTKGYRIPWFGFIDNGVMILNETGKVAHQCWGDIPKHFPNAVLHNFIVMPDHIHGIIELVNDPVGVQDFRVAPVGVQNVGVQNIEPQLRDQPRQNHYQKIIPRSIGSIVRGYKTGVTKWFRENETAGCIWQRNYYERIIRNENEFDRISRYIEENPVKWRVEKLLDS
jgi:putative transposase